MKKKLFSLFLVGSVISCAAQDPARIVSDRFVDHYYVQTNLSAALQDSDGLAAEKIKKSLELIQGQAIDASTYHPKISEKFLSVESPSETPQEKNVYYEIEIKPSQAEPLRKKTCIKLREKKAGEWKVTQFSDQEL